MPFYVLYSNIRAQKRTGNALISIHKTAVTLVQVLSINADTPVQVLSINADTPVVGN
jgi:hypothetical protein